jgi:CRISPR-associated protein Cas1
MIRMPSEAFRNPLAPDDFAWAERSANWLRSRPDKRGLGRPPRQSHEPLVLTGCGMCLRVDHGALVVRNGFTHYPQRAEEHRFFRGDRQLSSRIIVVDGSGILSFDVLSWLSEQNVPLIRLVVGNAICAHSWPSVSRSIQL